MSIPKGIVGEVQGFQWVDERIITSRTDDPNVTSISITEALSFSDGSPVPSDDELETMFWREENGF